MHWKRNVSNKIWRSSLNIVSGPRTPQRNGKVERKFQSLYGRIRAMMNDSEIDGEFRDGLWAECASTATYYDDSIINMGKKKSPIALMFKNRAKGLMNLKRFGEMCVPTTKNKIQGKLNNKGTVCVFVGYAVNHSDDVYRLLNPKTKSIIKSTDVVWSNKRYGFWIKSKNDTSVSDDSDSEIDNLKNKIETEKPFNDAPNDGKNERVASDLRQTSKLKSRFNPKPTRFIENSDSGRETVLEKADIALNLIDCLKEPETFEDAYYHPNHEERMKWREEISKEFNEMKEKGVYEKICKSELPNGRTCIKNKWVFEIKSNGIFRARLVACGYSQVPGVDYQESLSS
jgi:hypothetical protein